MRPFRRDTRFSGFVQRLRMIDYWNKHGGLPDGCELQARQLRCR